MCPPVEHSASTEQNLAAVGNRPARQHQVVATGVSLSFGRSCSPAGPHSRRRRGRTGCAWQRDRGPLPPQVLRVYEGLAAARQALALEASARGAEAEDEADDQAARESRGAVAPPPDEALRAAARAAMAAGEGVFAFPDSASVGSRGQCDALWLCPSCAAELRRSLQRLGLIHEKMLLPGICQSPTVTTTRSHTLIVTMAAGTIRRSSALVLRRRQSDSGRAAAPIL